MRKSKFLIDVTVGIGEVNTGTPTTLDLQTSDNGGTGVIQGNFSTKWSAQQFTAGATAVVESIDLKLSKPVSSVLTGNYEICIYSDSSDNPGSQLSTDSFPIASLTTSLSTVTNFVISSRPSVTSGQKYWIVIKPAFTNSVFELISAREQGPSAITELNKSSTNSGSTWSTTNDFDWYFVVNGLVF